MQPCAHLIRLADAINETAAPLLDAETHRARVLAHYPAGTSTQRAVAAIFDEGAARAADLKLAEQLLRELAQDADFHRFAEAKAAGRVLVAEQADRAGPVVVAGEDHRPAPQQVRPQRPAKALLGRLWPFGRAA